MQNIIIRCDVGDNVGWGHFKRCMLLANELSKSCDVLFVIKSHDLKSLKLEIDCKYETIYLQQSINLLEEIYLYPKSYQNILLDISNIQNLRRQNSINDYLWQLHSLKYNILYIDGDGDERLTTPNTPKIHCYIQPYISVNQSPVVKYKYWLTGTKYLLINPAYFEIKNKISLEHSPRRFLITFGGADPQWNTLKVLKGILNSRHHNKFFKIVIGPSFSKTLISELLSKSDNHENIEVVFNQTNLVDVFRWADMCIGASSTTRFEAAACQLPMHYISLYPEHTELSQSYSKLGISKYLGPFESVSIKEWTKHLNDMYSDLKQYQEMKQNLKKLKFSANGPRVLASKLFSYLEFKE